ncbi:MAG: hypothetical protein VB855_11425 [Pirellulaceae bacterium]
MIKRLFNALKQGIVLRMGYPPTAHREREEFILRLIKLLLKKASQVFEQGAVDEAVILYERAILLTEQVLVSGICSVQSPAISHARRTTLKQLEAFNESILDHEKRFVFMMACNAPSSGC